MATVTGARGTAHLDTSIRKIDMADDIRLLEPDAAPLTVLTSKLKKNPTHNPEFKWSEDALANRFDSVNGAIASTTTTAIVVADSTKFAQHDLVYNSRTGEVYLVNSVVTGTQTINVTRGFGGTAANINNADEIFVTGSAQPEGDTSKPARSSGPTVVSNYTQIQRRPFHVTETNRHSDVVVRTSDWNHAANKAGIEHKKDIEMMLWWGKKKEDTTGSQPRRASGGVFNFITTNVTDAGGAFTNTEFDTAMRSAFRYGSREKFGFGSPLAISVINNYAVGKLQVVDQARKEYGLDITRYRTPFGVVNFTYHNLLEGTTFGGYFVLLDLKELAYRPLANSQGSRDSHILTNIQAPDEDARKDEWLTEAGMEFGSEKTHALVYGITS